MKKTKTFSVEESIYETFDKMSDEKFLNKSQWIESKIQEYIDNNRFKDTIGANQIITKISDRISDFIEEDEVIQAQLEKIKKKGDLIVGIKMDSNFHRLEIKIDPKYPFNALTRYNCEIDDEPISIVDSTMNYVMLSNGNKLRIKDFEKLYSPIIDPDRFFRGEMALSECVTKGVVKESFSDKETKRMIKETQEVAQLAHQKIMDAQLKNLINVVVQEDPIKVEEFFADKAKTEIANEKFEEIIPDKFFKQGTENLFEVATKILQVDPSKLTYDKDVNTEIIENIPVYLEEDMGRYNQGGSKWTNQGKKQRNIASGVESDKTNYPIDENDYIDPSEKLREDIRKHLDYVNLNTIDNYIDQKSREHNEDGSPTEFNMEKDGLVGDIRKVDVIEDEDGIRSIGLTPAKIQKARNDFDSHLHRSHELDEDLYPRFMSEEERNDLMNKFIDSENLTGPQEDIN